MTDKLSRRYFTKMFTFGAIAAYAGAAVASTVQDKLVGAVEKVKETSEGSGTYVCNIVLTSYAYLGSIKLNLTIK